VGHLTLNTVLSVGPDGAVTLATVAQESAGGTRSTAVACDRAAKPYKRRAVATDNGNTLNGSFAEQKRKGASRGGSPLAPRPYARRDKELLRAASGGVTGSMDGRDRPAV
jgi:hypothetical protein